jgi:hypothetical protein
MMALKHLPDVTEDVLVFVLKRVLDAHIERKLVSTQVNGAATERRSRTDPPDLNEFVYRLLQCSRTPGLLKVAMKAQLPLEHTQALLVDLENIIEASSYSIWSDNAASRNTGGHQFNQVLKYPALFFQISERKYRSRLFNLSKTSSTRSSRRSCHKKPPRLV